jgi:hypothetical protein
MKKIAADRNYRMFKKGSSDSFITALEMVDKFAKCETNEDCVGSEEGTVSPRRKKWLIQKLDSTIPHLEAYREMLKNEG